jgi:hypothetical protein
MGAGLIQIDEPHFITNNSTKLNETFDTISFFPYRNVFRKHTRFGFEYKSEDNVIHPDNGSTAKFGQQSTFVISREGDLLHKMYLEIVLPNLTGGAAPLVTGGSNHRWVNSIAYALFDSVELQIHGSTIEKHTDLWFDLWNELTDEELKESTLVGKAPSIIGTTPDASSYNSATKWYLPLHFFFTRKPECSLPIFLLEENQVKIKINVKALNKLINHTGGTVSEAAQPTIRLYKQVIFLSKEEKQSIRNKFQKEGYEFLVDILDSTTNIQDQEVTATNFSVTRNQYTFPIKELVWVFRHKDRLSTTTPTVPATLNSTSGNDIFSYHTSAENTNLEGGIATRDPFSKLDIKVGNQSIFQETERNADHFRTIQPYYHHRRVNTKYVYSFSFAQNPHEFQPSGFLNLNTQMNENIDFHFKNIVATATDYRVSIYAYGYKILRYSKINDVTNTLRISLNHSGNANLKNTTESIRDSFETNKTQQKSVNNVEECTSTNSLPPSSSSSKPLKINKNIKQRLKNKKSQLQANNNKQNYQLSGVKY